MSQPAASVVVPCYRMPRALARCLDGLAGQRTAVPFEVVVVDSSPSDAAGAVVDAARSRFGAGRSLRLIRSEHRLHAGAARNAGARASTGDVLAFVDADCVPAPGWLDAHLAAQAPGVVVAGPVVPSSPSTAAGLALFAVEFAEFLPRRRSRTVTFAPSCNLSLARALFDAAGGFPEEHPRSHDLAFCWRLADRARIVALGDAGAAVAHAADASAGAAVAHLAVLGRASARVRRAERGPGAFLVDAPALVPLLVPWRLARVVVRVARADAPVALRLVAGPGWPLVGAALAVWAHAFFREARA